MGEEKPDTLDFVKDFQEYLSQQTQHVNMISGSVSGVKEADEMPPGTLLSKCACCGINVKCKLRRTMVAKIITTHDKS